MREIRPVIVDVDRFLEEAARAQQQQEADRWRQEHGDGPLTASLLVDRLRQRAGD